MGQQDGFFWIDAIGAYEVDTNVTTPEGCCNLCIADPQCQRYQVASSGALPGCSLLGTANSTSPTSGPSFVSVGLGEQGVRRAAHGRPAAAGALASIRAATWMLSGSHRTPCCSHAAAGAGATTVPIPAAVAQPKSPAQPESPRCQRC